MNTFRRIAAVIGVVALATGFAGCSYMPHFLQPHQLQKLNRGPNGTPASGYEGVSRDPSDGETRVYFAAIRDEVSEPAQECLGERRMLVE